MSTLYTLPVLTGNIDTLRAIDNERCDLVKRLAAGESVSSMAIAAGHRPNCKFFRDGIREAVNNIYCLVMMTAYFPDDASNYDKNLIGSLILNWDDPEKLLKKFPRNHVRATAFWLFKTFCVSSPDEFNSTMEWEKRKIRRFHKSLSE